MHLACPSREENMEKTDETWTCLQTGCAWQRNTCSSVEQSGQNDAHRLHRWLEHGSKAHLQRILSGRFAAASRQAHAKAASTSSLVAVKSSAAEPSHCVAAALSNQARTMPAAFTAGLSTAGRSTCSGLTLSSSHAAVKTTSSRSQRQQVTIGLVEVGAACHSETARC